MRIFYYQRPDHQPNFGDDLNLWLWPKLCPQLFPQNADSEDAEKELSPAAQTTFVGTGTLLNNRLAERVAPSKNLIIFSTGAGYEQPLRHIPKTWKICCVRGPLSARQLGLPPEKAIADGGLLVAQLFTPHAAPKGTSFMPHIHSANAAAETWQRICEQANIRFIDPRWPVETVLEAIGSSERLLAEAMHGAIVADALRIPWYPIVTMPRIYAFKWQDWCAAMELPYQPYRLPPLVDYPKWGRGIRSGMVAGRHWLGAGMQNVGSTLRYQFTASEGVIAKSLVEISQQRAFLSTQDIFQSRLHSLQTCVSKI